MLNSIQTIIAAVSPLFSYPLNITCYPAQNPQAEIMIFCHGYGSSADDVPYRVPTDIAHHVLSFDFLDARLGSKQYNPHTTSFGTINELLPLLAILKACVIDADLPKVHLYGFSAGGGAVINALAVLNTDTYSTELALVGITKSHKEAILQAIQRGTIILDSPLKSVEEIISFRGKNEELEILARRYTMNNLRPIDSSKQFSGLTLNIVLYFQEPDDVLSNRDDVVLYNNLSTSLTSSSHLLCIRTDNGGHNLYHPSLWDAYREFSRT